VGSKFGPPALIPRPYLYLSTGRCRFGTQADPKKACAKFASRTVVSANKFKWGGCHGCPDRRGDPRLGPRHVLVGGLSMSGFHQVGGSPWPRSWRSSGTASTTRGVMRSRPTPLAPCSQRIWASPCGRRSTSTRSTTRRPLAGRVLPRTSRWSVRERDPRPYVLVLTAGLNAGDSCDYSRSTECMSEFFGTPMSSCSRWASMSVAATVAAAVRTA